MPGQDPQRVGRRRAAQPGRPGHLGAAGLGAVEHLVDEPGRPAEHQERRVDRGDPARASPPPPGALGISGRDPELVAVGPRGLASAHQVDQRVRLVAQQLEHAGHRPVAQRRVQGQVPAAELEHGRARDHRRLPERQQHQADGDHPAAPPPDPLGVLERD